MLFDTVNPAKFVLANAPELARSARAVAAVMNFMFISVCFQMEASKYAFFVSEMRGMRGSAEIKYSLSIPVFILQLL